MIVWATEFPLPADAELADVLKTAEEWLTGSPHHPWGDMEFGEAPFGEVIESVREGQTVKRARFANANSEWAGLRHIWIENENREWTTDVVAWSHDDLARVAVRLECHLLVPGTKLPTPRKPYLAKMLVERFAGGEDAWMKVSDTPVRLEEYQVGDIASIIDGSVPSQLPVVYVSSGPGHMDQVDPDELSKWLSGMAHVVVEPSRNFSFALARNVNRNNPYGGAVAILWPRGFERQTRLFPKDFASPNRLATDVSDRIRSALAAVRPTPELTWTFLQEQIARQRIDELRSSGSTKVDDYIDAFDAELAAKDKRIQEAEREIGRMYAELARAEAASSSGSGVLSAGSEPEYYPSEITDTVLYALALSKSSINSNGRRMHIVDDLLNSNESSGTDEELASEIKHALTNSRGLDPSGRRALEDIGFSIEDDGKHYKAKYHGDNRYSFSISRTASDHRSGKNLASDVIKSLFK